MHIAFLFTADALSYPLSVAYALQKVGMGKDGCGRLQDMVEVWASVPTSAHPRLGVMYVCLPPWSPPTSSHSRLEAMYVCLPPWSSPTSAHFCHCPNHSPYPLLIALIRLRIISFIKIGLPVSILFEEFPPIPPQLTLHMVEPKTNKSN
jgi:hypothetical protein